MAHLGYVAQDAGWPVIAARAAGVALVVNVVGISGVAHAQSEQQGRLDVSASFGGTIR